MFPQVLLDSSRHQPEAKCQVRWTDDCHINGTIWAINRTQPRHHLHIFVQNSSTSMKTDTHAVSYPVMASFWLLRCFAIRSLNIHKDGKKDIHQSTGKFTVPCTSWLFAAQKYINLPEMMATSEYNKITQYTQYTTRHKVSSSTDMQLLVKIGRKAIIRIDKEQQQTAVCKCFRNSNSTTQRWLM